MLGETRTRFILRDTREAGAREQIDEAEVNQMSIFTTILSPSPLTSLSSSVIFLAPLAFASVAASQPGSALTRPLTVAGTQRRDWDFEVE